MCVSGVAHEGVSLYLQAGTDLSLWSDPFAGRSLVPFGGGLFGGGQFGGGLFGGGLFGGMNSMFESMRREMVSWSSARNVGEKG